MSFLKFALAPVLLAVFALSATLLAAEKPDQPAARPYPMTTCVVSGENLGEMGAPFVMNFEGREVKLCCPHCAAAFRKEPAKYLALMDKAEKDSAAKAADAKGDDAKGADAKGDDAKPSDSKAPATRPSTQPDGACTCAAGCQCQTPCQCKAKPTPAAG